MPKRKANLKPQIHGWLDGPESAGEIVLKIAEHLLVERTEHHHAGDLNQLSISALRRRRTEAVRQIDAAFSELAAYKTRQAHAGLASKQQTGNETKAKVRRFFDELTAKGLTVTAPAIETEWFKACHRDKGFGKPVSLQQIRRYLREFNTAKHP
jgi:hypothetical protein